MVGELEAGKEKRGEEGGFWGKGGRLGAPLRTRGAEGAAESS